MLERSVFTWGRLPEGRFISNVTAIRRVVIVVVVIIVVVVVAVVVVVTLMVTSSRRLELNLNAHVFT